MKKIIFFFMFICILANAKDSNAPSSFSIITFAINHYGLNSRGEPWRTNLDTPIENANTLVNSFKDNITKNYPSTSFKTPKQYTDAGVTKATFIKETDNYNFVYYDGHGGVDRITMCPNNERVWNNDKAFGGNTYWVMFSACQVFKKDEMNPFPWFNGVHSILGYSSSVTDYGTEKYKVKCGLLNLFSCSRTRKSSYVQRDFATNWIKAKQTIWESYKNAVYKWLVQGRDYGVEPIMVHLFGTVDGKHFDGSKETFENSIQKPLYRNSNLKLYKTICTFGTPEY
ncbi:MULTISPECIES: DUF6345 domain-containing protein [unclassified Fibrobacter]|uniref:DUF6345 domain-containing protein n=1 Tax=unclassified Fibrobacter TaxID=2634177 RepID=UPI0009153B60|nr:MULTISPECIES: DUF6345 domain-containing protein [unclassified Fibrobacter]OWV05938.1 hypothetical protein B7993_06855 [Fibrobacter sp. UWH3]SHL10694.1 hypothetical protein SAMN05720765_10967 [Fibrobacter sp. UWH6]